MPRPDPPHTGKANLRASMGASPYPKRPPRKRPRGKGGEPEREPVEPDRPRPLDGGAAAALEYDD